MPSRCCCCLLLVPPTRDLVVKFTNPDLCALTEQVIFQDPYYAAPLNRHTSPQLDAAAADLCADVAAKAAAFRLKQKFCQNAEALVHGDLHTGSIMVRCPVCPFNATIAGGCNRAAPEPPLTPLNPAPRLSLHPQVTPTSSKVIDPEFAYMGPLAFDPAKIIGEFIIPYFAADGHEAAARAAGSRAAQRVWLLEAIVEVWETFSKQ